MDASPPRWQIAASTQAPESWQKAVQAVCSKPLGGWAAQVLWQRQQIALGEVSGFLDETTYTPTPASAFGPPMARAVERIKQAIDRQETVTIWGDFDADGVTATAVLWDGLGPWFEPESTLRYYIPNRLQESHGLSKPGLDQVRDWGTGLIVTCDTGSTNLEEVAYAQALGMEVIITDHHTLPTVEPAAIAIINPRYFPADHPLATLSGVAVAYKLLEALYEALDPRPEVHLEYLLDLVAIGLIADLVNLTGDCRYLAQRGLKQLKTQQEDHPPHLRPGLRELLKRCQKTGDRPTDISFGLGPRINAVSRIHGDARFCVELLTSQDAARCQALAYGAELANTRRKGLQREVYDQVMERVAALDLATTHGLVLADAQWPTGILGLVAGQVSQALGRPTLLLTIDPPGTSTPQLARGSARSVPGLDLYDLFQTHADLLTSFGGHPLAAGLTLPVERLSMFTTAINRSIRERLGSLIPQPQLTIDLTVTVADLGPALFYELNLLEPYGMGHPVPRLLLRQVWFTQTQQKNLTDARDRKVHFIKTTFTLWDDTAQAGVPGEWWGHYREELPQGRCDVVVELDHSLRQGYHVKLVDVRPVAEAVANIQDSPEGADPFPADGFPWLMPDLGDLALAPPGLGQGDLGSDADLPNPGAVWQQLVGIAKYLARTQQPIPRSQLRDRLRLSDISLDLGLQALDSAGFHLNSHPVVGANLSPSPDPVLLQQFLEAVAEDQFRQRYWRQKYAQSRRATSVGAGPNPAEGSTP
ncbi:MAG: single-stranded-DNA-specific exonuclease RecJ [Leptolyngbya sp.]|nr:single-stranded-DNA-specific exonuclease RecJ [Leptolyngbya sp.]